MGEFSKRIGEIGEEIVIEFLALIGWHHPNRNFDIPSIDPEKHGKNTHGIDAYFHYQSPVITRTLENILISVKFSKDKYPNAPVNKFKAHYNDLGMAIESFKKSDLRSKTINNRSDFEFVFDRGIIFWLNNVDDSQDLLQKLFNLEAPKDFNHDGIFLVDNKKIEFFFNAIEFVNRKFLNKTIQFTYFNTGLNSDNTAYKNGSIMPVQYLASNILPIRVQTDADKYTLILCSRENFEEDELIKLIGLAKNITANYQSSTIIAFPDYNRLKHEQLVASAKLIFEEASFTNSLSVENFNPNFKN
ncbi:MAG: GapS4a family protein [Nitrososphaeraceae archaeon]